MKTLVIGSRGFLGDYFFNAYRENDLSVLGTQHLDPTAPYFFNLEKPDISHLPLEGYTYALFAASSGSISECEKNYEKTFSENVTGVLTLAEQFMRKNITPILFSSSYVFDGTTGNYTEESIQNPINAYGRQKTYLEKEIAKICKGNYLLLRLSKIFDIERGRGGLLDEIVSKIFNNKTLKVAYDQIFTPICVEDVVRIVLVLQKKKARGLFNLCGINRCNRLELTQLVLDIFDMSYEKIKKISLDELLDGIHRPKKTDMCCDKIISLGIAPPLSIGTYIKSMKKLWEKE